MLAFAIFMLIFAFSLGDKITVSKKVADYTRRHGGYYPKDKNKH